MAGGDAKRWAGARGWSQSGAIRSRGRRRVAASAGATWGRRWERQIALRWAQASAAARLVGRADAAVAAAGVLAVGALSLSLGVGAAPAAVWLLAWWFGSLALARRGRVGLPRSYVMRLWVVASGVGVLGLIGLGALGALSRPAVGGALPGSPWAPAFVAVLATVAVFVAANPFGGARPRLLVWASRQRDAVVPAVVAGAGTAGLLLSLALGGHGARSSSWALLTGIVLSGPFSAGVLLAEMRTALWTGDAGPGTSARLRRLVLRFVLAYGVVAAPAAFAGWAGNALAGPAQACALGAICLTASLSLVLGRRVRTAAVLFAAGAAVWLGAPAGPVLAIAYVVLALGLLEISSDVPRIGVRLLVGAGTR